MNDSPGPRSTVHPRDPSVTIRVNLSRSAPTSSTAVSSRLAFSTSIDSSAAAGGGRSTTSPLGETSRTSDWASASTIRLISRSRRNVRRGISPAMAQATPTSKLPCSSPGSIAGATASARSERPGPR
jgi:hypothetical protein